MTESFASPSKSTDDRFPNPSNSTPDEIERLRAMLLELKKLLSADSGDLDWEKIFAVFRREGIR